MKTQKIISFINTRKLSVIALAIILFLAPGLIAAKPVQTTTTNNPLNQIMTILGPKIVFLTSQTFTGNLGGIQGADKKCQDAAKAAGLAGTFFAWVSTDVSQPGTRFLTFSLGPYILAGGSTLAGNYGDLTDGSLNEPIARNENGEFVGSELVWTATYPSGTGEFASITCENWTSDSSGVDGSVGSNNATDGDWTDFSSTIPCNTLNHLYCFQQ